MELNQDKFFSARSGTAQYSGIIFCVVPLSIAVANSWEASIKTSEIQKGEVLHPARISQTPESRLMFFINEYQIFPSSHEKSGFSGKLPVHRAVSDR